MSDNAGSAKAADKSGKTEKKAATKNTGKTAKPSLNMKELQELAELVDEHGFTDFEFENENIRVRLSKNPAPQYFAAPPMQSAPQTSAPTGSPAQPSAPSGAETSRAEDTSEDLHQITSPIVGTFYSSPAPDKDPYVKEGSVVAADSVVCIVEAMKLMNEIQAEVAGEVVKIYVQNGQPVEYGQPLFGIKK
ncbi:MAG: acetyl-CoA carboxylase biotin carboxyl carrier protein [Pyrinomonadaceae bacterium]|nr:acetyl-CoA carboxylase biotin carboxyl carrier protein [Pyrinomonadaceae bacterium]